MAIKRVIWEVDDSLDTQKPTTAPTSLRDDEAKELTLEGGTSAPKESDEIVSSDDSEVAPRQGRTWPDLISDSVGDERIMVPLLMFVPFIFYLKEMKSVEDLLVPASVGALLVGLWAASSILRWWRTR